MTDLITDLMTDSKFEPRENATASEELEELRVKIRAARLHYAEWRRFEALIPCIGIKSDVLPTVREWRNGGSL